VIKLLAVDLDHTLLNEEHAISRRNKEAITKAMSLGVNVMICTGRMFRSALPFAQALGLKGPLVSYNGALVKDIATGRELYHEPLPADLAKQLLALARREKIHANFYYQDELYFEAWTREAEFYLAQVKVPWQEVGDLESFFPGPPTKLLFVMDEEKVKEMWQRLGQEYQGRLNVTVSESRYLEFLSPKVNKGRALSALMDMWQLQQDEVMAIGDSFNDLEILRTAGLAVAMGNAPDPVKEAADFVTRSNREDGVAVAIEKYLLA